MNGESVRYSVGARAAAVTDRLPAALPSRARMRGVVRLREVLVVEVRVDLRARDRRVAEKLLHGAEVARRLKHVRRERVPQHVRMNVPRKALEYRPGGESRLDRPRR